VGIDIAERVLKLAEDHLAEDVAPRVSLRHRAWRPQVRRLV
jgi:hypothetical protein